MNETTRSCSAARAVWPLSTINRPKALNALTLDNYRRFAPALRAWAADPSVHAVVVRGAGERAFCAGGDVRAVYEAGRGISGDPDLPAVFFREEYELIRRIHRFPKPYIAIIDGITMGGGAGISVNGAYRIATERTLFAMPETAIGLFPDVGATRFLNRCPGHIGRYLGLTGARLRAADALYCGFATHFVPHDRIAALVAALGRAKLEIGKERDRIDAALDRLRCGSRLGAARDIAAGDRPVLRGRQRRGDSRRARRRGGSGRRACRLGRGDTGGPADKIADQSQDHIAPAGHRTGVMISKRHSPSNTG